SLDSRRLHSRREHSSKRAISKTVTQFCSQGLGEVKPVRTKNTKWVLSGPATTPKICSRKIQLRRAIKHYEIKADI
ncbi:MAG: hypothetical protein WCC93_10090, partial [Chthoniobacterales bacterium]